MLESISIRRGLFADGPFTFQGRQGPSDGALVGPQDFERDAPIFEHFSPR